MRVDPIYGGCGSELLRPVWVRSRVHRDGAVVIAVPVVRMVQVPADEVVDVVAVRNLLVTAAGLMHVRSPMLAAGVLGRAVRRIGRADLQDMLVNVVAVRVMQMPVVQVVEVIAVLDRRVPAIGSVLVGVVWVNGVLGISHGVNIDRARVGHQIDGDERHSQPFVVVLSMRLRRSDSRASQLDGRAGEVMVLGQERLRDYAVGDGVRPLRGLRFYVAVQAAQAPWSTTSCSDTSSGTRSDRRLIARSSPSSEKGSRRPQRSQTR